MSAVRCFLNKVDCNGCNMSRGIIFMTIAVLATAPAVIVGEEVYLQEDSSSAKFVKALYQVSDSLDCLKDIVKDSLHASEKTSAGMVTKEQLDEHKGVMTEMKKDLQQVLMLTEEIKNSERTCNCDKTELEQVTAENEQLKVNAANRDKQVEELTAEIEKLKLNYRDTEDQVHQLELEVESQKQENHQCSSKVQQFEEALEETKKKNQQCESKVQQLMKDIEFEWQENQEKSLKVQQLTKDIEFERQENKEKSLKVQQIEEELQDSKKENQQCESKAQQLTKDIEFERQEKLYKSLEVQSLKEKLEESERREADLTANVKQLEAKVTSLNKTVEEKRICRQREEIKKLVLEFKGTKKWKTLKEGLQLLLDRSCEEYQQLQEVDTDTEYALFNAGMNGHAKLLSLLLDAEFPLDMPFSIQGDTLLHLATYSNHLPLARLLLIHGADVDAKRIKDGMTPLMWAAERGHVDLARLLVRAGADISIKNNNGQTALDRARTFGGTEIVQFMESL